MKCPISSAAVQTVGPDSVRQTSFDGQKLKPACNCDYLYSGISAPNAWWLQMHLSTARLQVQCNKRHDAITAELSDPYHTSSSTVCTHLLTSLP